MANQLRWVTAIVSLALLAAVPFFQPSLSPGRCGGLMIVTRKVKFSSNGHRALTTARRHCGLKQRHANEQRQVENWNPSKPVLHIFRITISKTLSRSSTTGDRSQRAGMVMIRQNDQDSGYQRHIARQVEVYETEIGNRGSRISFTQRKTSTNFIPKRQNTV